MRMKEAKLSVSNSIEDQNPPIAHHRDTIIHIVTHNQSASSPDED